MTKRQVFQSLQTAGTADEVDGDLPLRSLDAFLENAYTVGSYEGVCWQYWFIMLSLGAANSSDATEILCLSYILSDAAFDENMLQYSAWRAGLLAGSVFFGMLLGGLFIGTLGDWVGRKPMLLVGLICNAVAGIISAFCVNVFQMSLLRLIAGVGIGATVPPLFTLVSELAPPSRRGFFVSVAASFWMVGSIFVALAALCLLAGLNMSWRVFATACAVPSAVGALLVATLVPESPRFLAIQGHTEDGLNVANHMARQMGYTGPMLTLEEILQQFPRRSGLQHVHALATEDSSSIDRLYNAMTEALIEFRRSTSKLYSHQLRLTTWPLQMVWFSLSFGSYGILTWINTLFVAVHLENVYLNALLFSVSNLPGNVLSAVLMDRSGRATLLIGSVMAAALSLVFFAWFAWAGQSSSISATGVVLSACCFQAFTISAWNTIDTMTTELFPTTVRSSGVAVCAASGRVGAMIAQFVNGALVSHPVRLLLVASCTLVLGATTPCFLRDGDMSQQPLEDGLNDGSSSDEEPLPFLPSGGAPYESVDSEAQPSSSMDQNDRGGVVLT